MPRLGPRRPLELGKSVVEFRLTMADGDIKELLESEGNYSATIRKALRLYAVYRAGGLSGSSARPSVAAEQKQPLLSGGSDDPQGSDLAMASDDLLLSLEADWD